MSEVSIEVELDGWDGLLRQTPDAVGDALEHALQEAMEEGADRVRNSTEYQQRTGAYAASVKGGVQGRFLSGNLTGFVRATAPEANFLESGTQPHEIRPRDKKALRFQAGGQTVFARVVHHPGTKPLHLVEKSIGADEVTARCNDAVKAALRRLDA